MESEITENTEETTGKIGEENDMDEKAENNPNEGSAETTMTLVAAVTHNLNEDQDDVSSDSSTDYESMNPQLSMNESMLSQEARNDFSCDDIEDDYEYYLEYEEELVRLYTGDFIQNWIEAERSMENRIIITEIIEPRVVDKSKNVENAETKVTDTPKGLNRQLLTAEDDQRGIEMGGVTAEDPNVNKIDTQCAADVSDPPSSSKKRKTTFYNSN